jgi:hypothetical protein
MRRKRGGNRRHGVVYGGKFEDFSAHPPWPGGRRGWTGLGQGVYSLNGVVMGVRSSELEHRFWKKHNFCFSTHNLGRSRLLRHQFKNF